MDPKRILLILFLERDMNHARILLLSLLLILTPLLKGCVVAAVGAATGGVAVAVDRRTTGTILDDKAVEIKATHQLSQNKELWKKSHINVICYNNAILLVGQVPSERDRQYVEALMKDMPHIKKIYNELTIANPIPFSTRSQDTLITTQIKGKMVVSKEVKTSQIKVVTENGVVYLMGLTTPEEQIAATEIAREIKGVEKVVQIFEQS
jgi:osmotically-inducible protein OsmY